MATSVVFPRVQFFANNGRPLIGGRIHTYVAGSSTRARTYKDAAKAQPNANPIILDARGEASVYLAEGVEYKFVIEDSTGALIMTQEPVYGAVWPNAAEWPSDATLSYQYMTEAKAAVDSMGITRAPFDTYAQAVGALPGLTNGERIEVSIDETRSNARTRYKVQAGALVFVVNLDQTKIDLAAATGASRVGFQQEGAGAVSTTVQAKLREIVSVKDFGAVGDGVTNDAAAIQKAIDAAVAAGGSKVSLPRGNYLLSSGVSWSGSGVHLIGDGERATKITCNFVAGDILSIGDGTANPNDCSISGLSITSSVAKTSGAAIRFRNGHNLRASHIRLDSNLYWGFRFDGGAQQFIYCLDNFEINSGTVGVLVGEDGTLVQDFWMSTGIISGATDSGILLKHCSGFYFDHVDLLQCGTGITTFPDAGKTVYAGWLDAVIADTCNSHGWKVVTNGGAVAELTITNCWGSSCGVTDNGHGMHFDTGAGSISGVSITAPRCINNKGNGIHLASGNDYSIVNPQCLSNSQRGSGVKYGIEIGAGLQQWSISGGVCGQGGQFATNLQGYGIYINTGASVFYTILGVNVLGNVTGGIFDGGSGLVKHIANNIGYRTAKREAGAILNGASSAVITHELDATPQTTDIIVSPTVDPGAAGISRFWVSGATATTFTVSCTPAATANFFFAWDARVKGA